VDGIGQGSQLGSPRRKVGVLSVHGEISNSTAYPYISAILRALSLVPIIGTFSDCGVALETIACSNSYTGRRAESGVPV